MLKFIFRTLTGPSETRSRFENTKSTGGSGSNREWNRTWCNLHGTTKSALYHQLGTIFSSVCVELVDVGVFCFVQHWVLHA